MQALSSLCHALPESSHPCLSPVPRTPHLTCPAFPAIPPAVVLRASDALMFSTLEVLHLPRRSLLLPDLHPLCFSDGPRPAQYGPNLRLLCLYPQSLQAGRVPLPPWPPKKGSRGRGSGEDGSVGEIECPAQESLLFSGTVSGSAACPTSVCLHHSVPLCLSFFVHPSVCLCLSPPFCASPSAVSLHVSISAGPVPLSALSFSLRLPWAHL